MFTPTNPLDVPGLLRRIRRDLDLSQRELAGLLGVSRSTVGRLESGAQPISLAMFEVVLELVGWSLRDALAGGAQPCIEPMTDQAVLDNGGRRYPAHLDVHVPCDTPHWWLYAPRRDRPRPRADFEHRPRRDRRRSALGAPPYDHPTERERVVWIDDLAATRRIRVGRRSPGWFDDRSTVLGGGGAGRCSRTAGGGVWSEHGAPPHGSGVPQ